MSKLIELDADAVECILGVHVVFHDTEKVALWFMTENPLIGNVSPSAMLRMGRGEKLLKFINGCIDENHL